MLYAGSSGGDWRLINHINHLALKLRENMGVFCSDSRPRLGVLWNNDFLSANVNNIQINNVQLQG